MFWTDPYACPPCRTATVTFLWLQCLCLDLMLATAAAPGMRAAVGRAVRNAAPAAGMIMATSVAQPQMLS